MRQNILIVSEPHDSTDGDASLLATIQERIELCRQRTGKSYKKASEDGGLQKDYIRLTLKQNSMPSIDNLERIALGYETTVEYLTGKTEDPERPQSRLPDGKIADFPIIDVAQGKMRLRFDQVVSIETGRKILDLLNEDE